MRAVYLSPSGLEFRSDYPRPELTENEAIVQVRLAGICSTDLELVKGYFGFTGILGHEFVGEVVEAGDSRWLGRRVVSSINFADPATPEFAEFGLQHHPHRSVLGILNRDGAMADYVAVPTMNLLAVPDDVTNEQAVFSEPLAAAMRIEEQAKVSPSDPIAVIGAGRLGMLIGRVLSLGGARVRMLARSQRSLDLAASWGLETGLVEDADDDGFSFVVEATGNPAGLTHALRIVKPMGTVILKSTYAGPATIDLTKVVVGEVKLLGSRCGPMDAALRLLQAQTIPVTDMIDSRFPAGDALKAFERASSPECARYCSNSTDLWSPRQFYRWGCVASTPFKRLAD